MTDLLAMAQAAIGSVKTAKLKNVGSGPGDFELQFNPQRDSLRLTRRVRWDFRGDELDPVAKWGGDAWFLGTEEDRLSFTTLLDDTTGGKAAWAAAAAKSALAVGLMAATNPTSELFSATRLQVMAAGDLVTGAADSVAEAALRMIEANKPLHESDVHKQLKKLHKLTQPSTTHKDRAQPPILRLDWGDFDFTGVILSLDIRYLLVTEVGFVRRAQVDIDMAGRAFSAVKTVDAFMYDGR